MSSEPFIAVNARALLEQHGLDSFDALWALQLDAVDDPNIGRGGWSSVYRLELADTDGQVQSFYLKRQQNHLSRSLRHLGGEPTFAREFRAIQQYARQGIPALEAAFFAQRKTPEGRQAILLTRALDDYQPLDEWFARWSDLSWADKRDVTLACGALVHALHNTGRIHNCLYPKHIFARLAQDGAGARLIDLEKTRRALGQRDRVRDLDTLNRRSPALSRAIRLRFLLACQGKQRLDDEARALIAALNQRQQRKQAA